EAANALLITPAPVARPGVPRQRQRARTDRDRLAELCHRRPQRTPARLVACRLVRNVGNQCHRNCQISGPDRRTRSPAGRVTLTEERTLHCNFWLAETLRHS